MLKSLPVLAKEVSSWTTHDPTLSKVRTMLSSGWKDCTDPSLKPFTHMRRTQPRRRMYSLGLSGPRPTTRKGNCTGRTTPRIPWYCPDESSGSFFRLVAWRRQRHWTEGETVLTLSDKPAPFSNAQNTYYKTKKRIKIFTDEQKVW